MSSPPPLDLNFINTFLHQVWKDDLKVTPKQFQPIPSFDNHMDIVKEEQQIVKEDEASSRRTVLVNERILNLQMKNPTDFGGPIDWKFELSAFRVLPYPSYYTKPFHSIPGGWLSKFAAENNRIAMQAIYQDAHPEACEGVRKELSKFVPKSSTRIVDLGSGDGDGPAITARMFPSAKVIAIEASPFMIVCGRRQNRDCVNLEFHHQLAENTYIPSNSIDTVTVTLLLHECSNEGKRNILTEAYRILKPNGTIVLTDTPQNDLFTYRGFYEPWKHQWKDFNATKSLSNVGFVNIIDHGIVGGDGHVKSIEEHKETSVESTDNRLFVFTAMKKMKSSL